MLEGTVVNGAIVLDNGLLLPEGTRVRLEVVEDLPEDNWPDMVDPSLPADHPCAPYNREVELEILRASIEEMKSGGGRPFEEVMAEIAAKHNLPPVPPE
jgi:hypothetical protein